MTITLDGSSLTIEKLVAIARDRRKSGTRPRSPGAHQSLPRHAGGETGCPRDHVRHQHRHRRVFGEDPLRRAGEGIPEISHLQPRRRDRRPGSGRARARRAGGTHQRPCAWEFRLPSRDHADPGGDAQQGRHAGGLQERLGRRLRRPGSHGAGHAPADGGGRSLLSTANGCPGPKR